jgi:hypothetical protein
VKLTAPMRDLLWTIAQHQHGWTHCSNTGSQRTLQTAEALERRGLVHVTDRGGRHAAASATDGGYALITRLFPVSPFALNTYDWRLVRELFGHWTPRPA